MTKIILAAAAAAALHTATPLVVGSTPAQAQGVEIGPGGIRVDPDRRDRDYYRDRRDFPQPFFTPSKLIAAAKCKSSMLCTLSFARPLPSTSRS